MSSMLCIGHRGARGLEPENTLRSFECALKFGATWIELDLWQVQNQLLVFHDRNLERVTNGTGVITERSVEYLRSLDAGKGERIPLLHEVLDLVCGRAKVNIEIKGPQVVEALATLLEQRFAAKILATDEILVSSFDHQQLRQFKSRCPAVPIAVLTYGVPLTLAQTGSELGAQNVHMDLEFCSAEYVADAHRRGLKVYIYTVNEPTDYEYVRSLGADGIFTDYPNRFASR